MNEFGGSAMATGYARWRPAVHPLVIEDVCKCTGKRHVGLDVGCGAGLSTLALRRTARVCIGIDPVESMVRAAGTGLYMVGAAEELPLRSGSVDLISAAGSLNYVDLDRFFPEARRVLSDGGVLVVYDFSPGRSFGDGDTSLDEWFDEFQRTYPPPAGTARKLDPSILAHVALGFRVVQAQTFEYLLTLTPEFYLEYVLTETSVSDAVRRGTPMESIRGWCAESLAFFDRPRPVLFRGYFTVCEPEQ